LDRSHLEPDIVAVGIQKILKSKVDFTLLDYAYLNIILHNLSLYSEELWINEAMGTVPQEIVQIEWMGLLLEAELALHIWHSSDKRIGYLLLEELLTNTELKTHAFLLPRLLNWAGSMALAENEIIDAQKYLLRSIYLSGRYNEHLSQSKSHYNLGKMYLIMGQGQQALNHIQSARHLYSQLPNPDHSIQQLYWYNESVIQGQIGNITAAKSADLQAHKYFELSNKTLRYQILDIRSKINIALLNKEYSHAGTLLEQCIFLSQQEQLTYNLGRCYLKQSKLEVAQYNYPDALKAIDQSIHNFRLNDKSYPIFKSMKYKAKILELSGDYKFAYELAKQVYLSEKNQMLSKLHNLTHAQEILDLLLQRDQLSINNQEKILALTKKQRYLAYAKWFGMIAILLIVLMSVRTYLIKRENRSLVIRSGVDQLTGLYNRHYYYLQLSKGENISLHNEYYLALLDIDYFKLINDTYGHMVGDEVLKKLAEAVQSKLHAKELFVRWGGEEFLLLIRADGRAIQRLENIRKIIASSPLQ
ncbi:hypothetical protein VII00023_12431, partial [Vibrio ichthyoenteri ATCC 700023]